MKGFIGVDSCVDLAAGTVGITGHNLETRLVVVRPATEEEARASAEGMGHNLVVNEGEHFYEVEWSTLPVGGSN